MYEGYPPVEGYPNVPFGPDKKLVQAETSKYLGMLALLWLVGQMAAGVHLLEVLFLVGILVMAGFALFKARNLLRLGHPAHLLQWSAIVYGVVTMLALVAAFMRLTSPNSNGLIPLSQTYPSAMRGMLTAILYSEVLVFVAVTIASSITAIVLAAKGLPLRQAKVGLTTGIIALIGWGVYLIILILFAFLFSLLT